MNKTANQDQYIDSVHSDRRTAMCECMVKAVTDA